MIGNGVGRRDERPLGVAPFTRRAPCSCRELLFMCVQMAIIAFVARLALCQRSLYRLLGGSTVALRALCGLVGIPQREPGFTMIERHCLPILPTTLHMTFLATLRDTPRHELAAMRVGVTVHALPELFDHEPRTPGLPASMTPLTESCRVLSPQRKTGRTVIEMRCNTRAPTGGRMTALARLLEFSCVRVLVTRRARGELQSGIRDHPTGRRGAMAFAALHFLMPACECEPCPIVGESRRRFPALLAVTCGACLRELASVMILVATQAFSPEAEERPRFHSGGIAPDAFLTDIGRPVTRDAGVARVLPRQGEPCSLVIEMRRIEPYDAEPPSVVFLVAFHALVGAEAPMEAGTARHPVRNVRMTTETFLIVDVLAEAVACRAFVHAFQGCVRGRQLARRDLSPDGRG